MKNKKHWFVTDMAPNGCRDVVVTDSNFEVIGWVSEAVFGNLPETQRNARPNSVLSGVDDEVIALDAATEIDYEYDTVLWEVEYFNIFNMLACSPVDPSGGRVLQRIGELLAA